MLLATDALAFSLEAMFFHRGFFYEEPVAIHEITPEGERDVLFDPLRPACGLAIYALRSRLRFEVLTAAAVHPSWGTAPRVDSDGDEAELRRAS